MFRTVPLSIIRRLFTVHSGMVHVILVCRQLSSRTRMGRTKKSEVIWSEVNWRDLCEMILIWGEVNSGEVTGDKSAMYIRVTLYWGCGPGSVVGIATAYGLDGPGIESRWGARFSAPVQTSPEIHPASCTMSAGSFPGVRCGRGVTLTPPPLLAQRSKIEYRAIPLLSLRAFVTCESVKCTLYWG